MVLNILSMIPLSEAGQTQIEGTDPSIRLIMAPNWFHGEFRDTWPEYTSRSYLPPNLKGEGTREQRNTLLEESEIVLGGFPFPLDLRSRAPNMKWFHQTPAGASNLLNGDLWGSDVLVTTSRGLGNTQAMAEWTVATFYYFARNFHVANSDRVKGNFERLAYDPFQIKDKTVCVIGTGGIGKDVGKLCAGIGMRVIGTRRSTGQRPDGFDAIYTPDKLVEILPDADFVSVCCQWTPETEKLIGEDTFGAMKDGVVLCNLARGEIVDETALKLALASGKIRGVGLDVYVGEFERLPDLELWKDDRVLFTPHISAATDVRGTRQIDLFCRNLKAYVAGQPLENVLDWKRGY
ncbi:MAG: D-2-hydroxyacid dehydrogenase [Pseudomonadota bacterium]|nr:D-2-hydroxyacid dehydrogenase [Pseudomonadota bacterium]